MVNLLTTTQHIYHLTIIIKPLAFILLILTTYFTLEIQAWGKLGHSLSARVAMHMLSDHTKSQLHNILPNVAGDIYLVSSWADRVKRLQKYSNTGPLHYSDAHDNPPLSCSYSYRRDCPSGKCVVAAIRDMTNILLKHTREPNSSNVSDRSTNLKQESFVAPDLFPTIGTRQHRFLLISARNSETSFPVTNYSPAEALKFLIHFVQDIHQPLHLSGRGRGGNNVHVQFNGKSTNLHKVWDSDILEKALTEHHHGSEQFFVEELLKKSRQDWNVELDSWTTCPSSATLSIPLLAEMSTIEEVMCPEYWAKGVDVLNCNNVWQATDFNPSYDLAGQYYQDNLPVIYKSIAMSGLRLAAVLEAIFNSDKI